MEDLKLIPNFCIQDCTGISWKSLMMMLHLLLEGSRNAGSHFLKLSEEQISKMVPAIGDIVDLQTLQGVVRRAQLQVWYNVNCAFL